LTVGGKGGTQSTGGKFTGSCFINFCDPKEGGGDKLKGGKLKVPARKPKKRRNSDAGKVECYPPWGISETYLYGRRDWKMKGPGTHNGWYSKRSLGSVANSKKKEKKNEPEGGRKENGKTFAEVVVTVR